ncbi:MAG: prepilin peptidase [Chloroflexi bacterium]|nr:prepilin peptidase [Chloroflexota bacterium]
MVGAVLLLRGREPAEAALAAGFGGAFWVLASADLRSMVIPNRLVYPLLAAALLAAASGSWPDRGTTESAAGGLAALAVAIAVRVLSRGGLGGGDVKMAALVGSVVGISALSAAALVTAVTGGAAAALLLVARRAERSSRLPYGPFLAAGGLAALLC